MQYGFKLMLLSVIISFLGFVTENLWLLFTKGYIDNRSMILPFLSGYGILVIGFYLLFGTPAEMRFEISDNQLSNDVVYYLLAFLTVSVGEILLGSFVEKAIGIIYWDYSWIPFHLTRYTSLPTSLGFALIIMLFMKYCFTPIMNWLSLVPDTLLFPSAFFLFGFTCLDTLHSFAVMYKTHNLYCLWRITLAHDLTCSFILYQ